MRIRLSEPRLLPDLVGHLVLNGCVAQRLDAATCSVVHVDALDAREARVELLFFLRAWEADHAGVTAVLDA